MMTKKESNKFNILNYLPVLFIGGILCTALTCITTQAPALPFISEEAPAITKEVPVFATDTSAIFQVVETMPCFNGNLQKWLKENMKYPEQAVANKEEGRVLITFIVEKDGSISNAKASKKVSPLLDAEALRIVNSMPAWTPGKQRGQAVRVAFTLPIFFQLQESAIFQVVEVMPHFNGNIHVWLKENMKYPVKSFEAKEQGKVFVNFIVDEDGTLSNFNIQRSSGFQLLDEEALRVTQSMPAWIPGKQRGKAVKVSYILPINFSLK